jgi:glycosyltransferase involved in cell wall biosynthesis
MSPDISIIIPAHNEESYIEKTLDSIDCQTLQDYEVIIVPNGCTDKTETVVNSRINDKIKSFPITEAHVSLARNHGAKEARGNLLVFLDADTTLEKDSLEKIKKQFKEDHAIATTLAKPDENKFSYNLSQKFKNLYNYTGLYRGCSGVLICRKNQFNQVKGYPMLKLAEHRKLTLKLLKFGKYSCVKTYATTSMRRYQQWGLGKTIFVHSYHWVKRHLGRSIKNDDYETVR